MLIYKTRIDWKITYQVNYEIYCNIHSLLMHLYPATDSRIVLISSVPEATYINANYIKV